MSPKPFRVVAGGSALAAGLFALAASTTAAPPTPAAYKKAAEADVAFAQKSLADGKPAKGTPRTLKAVAVLLVAYGEKAGDAGLSGAAGKLAAELGKKKSDPAALAAAAKGLSAPKGAAVSVADAAKAVGLSLEDVMSPYRIARSGGLNMESDIRAGKKGTVDAKVAELIGLRGQFLAEWTAARPAESVKSAADKAQWEKWSKEMGELAAKLADEAAKPKADAKALAKILDQVDANCVACHNKFRNE